MPDWEIQTGDCRAVMETLPPDSIDAVVTDPPYEIDFMNRTWDRRGAAYDPKTWAECFRIMKPGAHLIAFGFTRTAHRMVCAIEDVGFEVRDSLDWLYGSGMPKSVNLGDGYGTGLKPCHEPIALVRKPLVGTLVQNMADWGTGGLNLAACKLEGESWARPASNAIDRIYGDFKNDRDRQGDGRWPPNMLLDEAAAAMIGAPARFFYTAKASRADRDEGLEHRALVSPSEITGRSSDDAPGQDNPRAGVRSGQRRNTHPTVKPLALMAWLVRLVMPPPEMVPAPALVDPFAGSGTTIIAAHDAGYAQSLGIEECEETAELARERIRGRLGLFA